MSNRFENRSKFTLFLVITFITILLVILFEMLLEFSLGHKAGDNRYIRLRENAPHLNWNITPSDEKLTLSENLEQKPYRFATDKNGFLLPSLVHENADLTLAFIGGSTTECMYVDADKRFHYVVGQSLSNDTRKVNTINAGVSGNDSLNSINAYLNKIIPLKPNIAILMHNINDLSTLLHEGSYWNKNAYRSPIVYDDKSLKAFIKTALPNSFELLYRLKSQFTGPVDEFAHDRGKTKTFDSKHIYQQFEENLTLFISISKAKGIQPILMTQANRFTDEPPKVVMAEFKNLETLGIEYLQFKTLFDGMNDRIRQVALKHNITLIDLAKNIPPTREYIVDSVHFNNEGSELVAKLITEQLENNHQIKKQSK